MGTNLREDLDRNCVSMELVNDSQTGRHQIADKERSSTQIQRDTRSFLADINQWGNIDKSVKFERTWDVHSSVVSEEYKSLLEAVHL